jgi:hypothetical protein
MQNQSYELKPDLGKLRVQVQRRALPQSEQQAVDAEQSNLCFTMRSYYFHRQDGQAPVLAGATTCTPAKKFQQKQVSPAQGGLFVPLGLSSSDVKTPE